ncbi:MAG: anthranilate phosphoribosyltransferase [Phycisphaeraceae bacterium]|nr:anthranilate phosphoribosyltransferase [Phycisphaeraceae bacterium]
MSAPHNAQSGLPGPPEFAGASKPDPGALTPQLAALVAGRSLSESDAAAAFEVIADGRASEPEIGALLALLATRVPTADELAGAVRVMRGRVDRIPTAIAPEEILDTAGTGGAPKTFNVSTAAAIVAASVGARVAKHGNRSRTGRGSAEVLSAVGVNVEAGREAQVRSLEHCNICFAFAVHHHPAARHALGARKALGIPTIFNLVGPLVNPAGAERQVVGVYHPALVDPMAAALARLGSRRALVLHSDDGLDELSIHASSRVVEVRQGTISEWRVDPQRVVPPDSKSTSSRSINPSSLREAASLFQAVLHGDERGDARRMVLLNAGAALLAAERVRALEEGIAAAASAIDFGDAWRTLGALAESSGGRLIDLRDT